MGDVTFGLVALAFATGMISFLSPCVFPLVPSYLTFITGMSLDELAGSGQSGAAQKAAARRAVLVHGSLFVAGFSLVNIALGASATFIGSLLLFASDWIGRLGGAILILFGLFLLGAFRFAGANREWRFRVSDQPLGRFGTIVVGATFGAAWTPCTGPLIGSIMLAAATQETVGDGVAMLFVYSLGQATPFLLSALLLDRYLAYRRGAGRWLAVLSRASGVVLLVIGILMVTGSFAMLTALADGLTPAFLRARL